MNKNTGKNIGIMVMSGFILRLIFRLVENSNKSAIIQGSILIVLCIIAAVYMYSANKKILGNKLSIVGAILLVVAGSAISVGHIIIEYYPQLYKQYKTLIIHIELGSFIALMIFFLIAIIIKENK
ncbi:hypothetical protein [Clostridium beijerinckii]|uniref:hypothetical protein n=1 Tax=Clostridium beijerinckii TaxID=1520 RepID=UPI001F4069D1|nr:hypothetical protein [Clostridium beijerinckii]